MADHRADPFREAVWGNLYSLNTAFSSSQQHRMPASCWSKVTFRGQGSTSTAHVISRLVCLGRHKFTMVLVSPKLCGDYTQGLVALGRFPLPILQRAAGPQACRTRTQIPSTGTNGDVECFRFVQDFLFLLKNIVRRCAVYVES